MKSANWISAIGMRPLSAAPIAMPTMPDSARGISRTRASPNFAYSPSVAPKTPPLRPTSSPMTSTRSSRSISSVMAARTASIIRISATFSIPRPHIVQRPGLVDCTSGGARVNKSVRTPGTNPGEVVGISFSADVKNEMAGLLPARPCCQLSELLGIYFGSRSRLIKRSPEGQAAYFSLLRNAVARKVVRLGRAVGHMDAKYQAVKSRKRMSFFIELALPAGLAPAFTQAGARAMPDAACDRKAMLRGLFLGCGSVNVPSSRYHLEFVAPTASWARAIGDVAESAGARVGIMERSGQNVVYVKEGDGIVRLLSWMGASRAVMEFESVRVVREVSGEVNRRLNFETANIGKTVGSGLRQAAAIERLETTGKLDGLPPALREMAHWRSANPELNLGELARRMKLSKSAVNHRLRRLQDVADHTGGGRS